jgi:hypothetical protein
MSALGVRRKSRGYDQSGHPDQAQSAEPGNGEIATRLETAETTQKVTIQPGGTRIPLPWLYRRA